MATRLAEKVDKARTVADALLAAQPARRQGQRSAFIYARCSSDPQGRGKSVERQVEDAWRDCERNGWWVAGVFIDNDRSASVYAHKDREDYDRMVVAMRRSPVNVLVCWEASRATRDVRAYLDLSDLSRELKVQWCFNGTMFDLDDADDEFRALLDVGLNHREVRKLSQRVRDGIAKSARDGLPHGGPIPYGYYRRYDERTREFVAQEVDNVDREVVGPAGEIVIYTPEAIVREIFQKIAAGDSLHGVVKDLNARRIPSPADKKWCTQRIREMCQNPVYAGWRSHLKTVVHKGVWEPIVDEATFIATKARMEDPKRKTNHRKGSAAVHLLSFLARCGKCSSPMTYGTRKAKVPNKRRAIYQCKVGCVAVKSDILDAFVESVVIARLSDPKTLDWLIRPDDTESHAIAEKVVELRTMLDKWKHRAKQGLVDPDEYREISEGLRQKISDLEAEAAPSWVPFVVRGLVGEHAAEAWDNLKLSAKRDALSALVGIAVMPAGMGKPFHPARVQLTWLLENGKPQAPA